MSTVFVFTGFSPHGVCLAWQPGLIWLTAAASVMTATAYFSISAALIALLLRRPDFGYRGVAVLFATFILACGTTHVFGVVTLWVPLYWLSGAMDAVAAVLSVATAILLWPLIPQLVGLPSPRALREANRRLQAAEAVTAQANHWLAMGEQIAQVGHWRQNSAQDPMIWSDEMFRIFDLPHTGGEVSQAEMGATWHPEDRDIVSAAAAAAFRDGAGFDVSARALRPCGEIRHLRFRGSVQSSQDGKAGALFGICADRTEQAEIERQLHRARSDAMAANRRLEDLALQDALTGLERIMDNLPGYIFQRVRKPDGTYGFSYFSRSYWHILGFADIPPLDTLDAYAHIHAEDVARVRQSVENSVSTLSEVTIEFRALAANGRLLWLRTHAMPRNLPDGEIVWDGVGVDITAERAAQEELAYLAYHDPLTGLLNRMRFKQLMSEAVDHATASASRLGVFAVDLDGLQDINDELGPPVGDAVLQCVAQRLALFCGTDGATGRLGGDEFAVFRSVSPAGPSILDSATFLCRELGRPMMIDGHEITVEACVGATVYPFTERDRAGLESGCDEIIKQSNLALSQAKFSGSGVACRYTADMDDGERHRAVLRRSLQRGFIEAQFHLLYHPLIDLASGRIMGAEALLRWQHPDLGLQRPDRFIPMAEASGLIVPLGAWVLRTALLEMHGWARPGTETTRVSVNVSSVQLRDAGFLPMIDAVLAETGADPGLVDLELTESVLIEATGATIAILDALRARGFRLALDDFGTGYSSFRCLQDLPIDKIKIDQTFVRRVTLDTGDDAIVKAMLSVAKRLGLEVIAEGIETVAQRDFVRDAGCRIGQGYLFSLPVTPSDFGRLLERRIVLPAPGPG